MIQPEARPKLGFLGTGWIGRHRMQALAGSGLVEIAAVADPAPEQLAAARMLAPAAAVGSTLQDLLAMELDGLVIATPSALHADQAVAALERGFAVFCQKPLGRTAGETRRVVAAARRRDLHLGVDLSYRHMEGVQRIRQLVQAGGLGQVYAVDLVFHNAYGPDKPWFYDPLLAGGGCVIDLGIHLVDLALWVLDRPAVCAAGARLFSQGAPLSRRTDLVEDYAVATLELANGAVVRLACSWNLPAGRDAVIEAAFYGTQGGAVVRNVDGSFYDFTAEHYRGTRRETLSTPPDAWGGRAAVAWASELAAGARFDPAVEGLVEVAGVIDVLYGRSSPEAAA
jgi:predicted dehydrogenase